MKAFKLAVGLRVIGRAVADAQTEPDEPDIESAEMAGRAGRAPGCAIVRVDPGRQSIALEDAPQLSLNGGGVGPFARLNGQVEARMVIEQGQRIAAPGEGLEMAFEVELP